jgi:hypothetical protein
MRRSPGARFAGGVAPPEWRHLRRRQDLLSGVVGELQVIGGYADLLLNLPPDDPRRREGEKILGEVAALHRFIAETAL